MKLIHQLEIYFKIVEEKIKRLIDFDPSYKERYWLFNFISGIGPKLASFLIILMHTDPDPYNPKALAALLIFVPIRTAVVPPDTAGYFLSLWTRSHQPLDPSGGYVCPPALPKVQILFSQKMC